MNDSPQTAFRALLGNRVLQVLLVIMALLGIYVEVIAAIRGTVDLGRAQSEATSAAAEAAAKTYNPDRKKLAKPQD